MDEGQPLFHVVPQHHSLLLHYYLFTLHFLLLPPPGEVPATQGIGVFLLLSALPRKNPSGSADPPPLRGEAKERDHKPSPWGKVPAQQADEGPRKTNTVHIFCAVPHPALSGHPPPRGGLCTSSLLPLHSSLFLASPSGGSGPAGACKRATARQGGS